MDYLILLNAFLILHKFIVIYFYRNISYHVPVQTKLKQLTLSVYNFQSLNENGYFKTNAT